MNIAFQLFQVQRIDSDADKMNKRLDQIQDFIENNSKISNAEKAYESKKDYYVKRTNEFNAINDKIEKKKIKKSQSQSSLYSGKVQNPKELEDLQHEIESLQKTVDKLEESQMEALVLLDGAEKDLSTAKNNLKKARSEFATELSLLNAEKEKLTQNLQRLKSQRKPIYTSISVDYQQKYETLRKKKMGIAVTSLSENSCKACGANLTASQQQTARASTKVFICPNCGRIIYGS